MADISKALEQIREQRKGTLEDTLGINFLLLEKDCVKAEMKVERRVMQPFGLLHGGASVALAETVASIGGWLNCNPDTEAVVCGEINANHISTATAGTVTATATPIHKGAKTQVWETRIENDKGRLVSISRATLFVIARR